MFALIYDDHRSKITRCGKCTQHISIHQKNLISPYHDSFLMRTFQRVSIETDTKMVNSKHIPHSQTAFELLLNDLPFKFTLILQKVLPILLEI